MILASNDTAFYKYNASDPRFLHLRPNNLLLWKAIEACHGQCYRYFDLGRCSHQEQGLRRFKRLWGSQEQELPYYYYPQVRGVNSRINGGFSYRLMKLFVRYAPQPILQAVGSAMYRHLG